MNFGGMTTQAFNDRLNTVLMLVIGLSAGALILEVVLYYFFSKILRTRHALAFPLLSPAVIALTLFTVYPMLYNVQLAFSDLRLKTFPCYTAAQQSSAACPLAQIDVGTTPQVAFDSPLHNEPGDSSPTAGK